MNVDTIHFKHLYGMYTQSSFSYSPWTICEALQALFLIAKLTFDYNLTLSIVTLISHMWYTHNVPIQYGIIYLKYDKLVFPTVKFTFCYKL